MEISEALAAGALVGKGNVLGSAESLAGDRYLRYYRNTHENTHHVFSISCALGEEMNDNIVNQQQMDARILMERLENQRATLTLAIEMNERYTNDPSQFFASWQEFSDYLAALHEARDECDRFIKALKKPYE